MANVLDVVFDPNKRRSHDQTIRQSHNLTCRRNIVISMISTPGLAGSRSGGNELGLVGTEKQNPVWVNLDCLGHKAGLATKNWTTLTDIFV